MKPIVIIPPLVEKLTDEHAIVILKDCYGKKVAWVNDLKIQGEGLTVSDAIASLEEKLQQLPQNET